MDDKVKRLKEIIEQTNNLVFLAEREFPRRAGFRTLEVPMVYII